MDERSLATSEATTQRLNDLAIEKSQSQTKTYTVIALGHNDDEPFPIKAATRQERAEKMAEAGISLHKSHWAAGYIDHNRQLQIAFNNDEARRLVEEHLRKKR